VAIVSAVGFAQVALAQDDDLEVETKQPFVNKILFEGNSFFSDKRLRGQMHTKESTFFSLFRMPRYDADVLQRDIAALAAAYHANGFLEATVRLKQLVQLEGGTFVDIRIEIVEKEPTRIETVTFASTGVLDKKELSKGLLLQPGSPYNPSLLGSDINAIKLKYFEHGHLAVVVNDSVSVTGKRVVLRYGIDPGPVIHIRSIDVTGNVLTRRFIVDKEVTLRVGEVFRLKDAVETQRNLFETGLFTEAEVIPESLDMAGRSVAVRISLRERKSAYFEVGFGVGNIVGSRVTAGWGDRNLFGRGRTLRFGVQYAFALFPRGEEFSQYDPRVRYYRYDLTFAQRRVFGTKLLLGVTGYIEKDATVENLIVWTRGAAIGGGRRISATTEITGGFAVERVKNQSIAGETRSNTHAISTALRNDTRDFILDPRSGIFRDVGGTLAGGFLGGDNDFYTLSSSLQKYWAAWGTRTIAARVRVGYADSYGRSPEVPVENRFFTGGGNSVRGYEENSIGPRELVQNVTTNELEETVVGGRVFLLTNAEVRFGLPLLSKWHFSGALFADGGNVWKDPESLSFNNLRVFQGGSEVVQEDYRYGIGFGIRYNTPLGPIRVDYGIPLTVEEGMDGSGRFHFSLGQIF
jgi:outer membrane protein insertion porin family